VNVAGCGRVCIGDSDCAKAVFLGGILRYGDNCSRSAETETDISSLRLVLSLCSAVCPVTISHGDKQHYVVRVPGTCDPVVLENAEAVKQLVKLMSVDNDELMSWITVHLPSDLLRVIFASRSL